MDLDNGKEGGHSGVALRQQWDIWFACEMKKPNGERMSSLRDY